MHPNLAVISDEARFLKRFMKTLTRDRVVPSSQPISPPSQEEACAEHVRKAHRRGQTTEDVNQALPYPTPASVSGISSGNLTILFLKA